MSKRPGFFKRLFTSKNSLPKSSSKTTSIGVGSAYETFSNDSPRGSKEVSSPLNPDTNTNGPDVPVMNTSQLSVTKIDSGGNESATSAVMSPTIPMLDIEPSSPLFPSGLSKFPSSGTMREINLENAVKSKDSVKKDNSDNVEVHEVDSFADTSMKNKGQEKNLVNHSNSENSDLITASKTRKVSNFSIPRQKKLPQEDSVAKMLYDGKATFITPDEYACWLGSDGEEQKEVRVQFMSMFNFSSKSILMSLRMLCDKLYMKGESQQLNRVIEAFSHSWVQQNPNHGFYDANVVYTIAYALVLLNTDIYAADHTVNKKMSKSSFVHNTMDTIWVHSNNRQHHSDGHTSEDGSPNSAHHAKQASVALATVTSVPSSNSTANDTNNLVNEPSVAPLTKEWGFQIEAILKVFYISVSKEALKLHLIESTPPVISSTIYSTSQLHSAISTPSLRSGTNSNAHGINTPSLFGRMSLGRLRGRQYENQSRLGNYLGGRGNDTFRRDSLGSMFSTDTSFSAFGLNKHAVGFAGLLWNSMIKEEGSSSISGNGDDDFGDFSKIEQELAREVELELLGAPWAKEGLLRYRPYIDPNTGKKPRKKEWNQIFVVVQRGQLKMFKFESGKNKSSSTVPVNGVVGGGNWMENANMIDGFHLCHSMAQELPPPRKNNGFSALWSLTLPQRGLLVFQAGTSEIAREFVYTCNYWAGRLSKEPLEESVSSVEYGWSPNLLRCIDNKNSIKGPQRSSGILPGDKITIKEWRPSGETLIVSDVNEEKQLRNIQEYVEHAENDLAQHSMLRSKLSQIFTMNSLNSTKAHNNWERKSQYLLQQVIRYKTYGDNLDKAIKDRIQKAPFDSASSGSMNTVEDPDTVASSASSNTEIFEKDSEQEVFGRGVTV